MNNKIALALTIGLALASGACKHNHEDHAAHEHEHEHGHEHGAEVTSPAHDHGSEIMLHDEVAERFGVTFDTLRAGTFHEAVRATGRIELTGSEMAVVSAPASGTVHYAKGINPGSDVRAGATIAIIDSRGTSGGDANAAAKAALDAAKRELDRLTPLYEDRLVTASDYNAAVSAYEQAKAVYLSLIHI